MNLSFTCQLSQTGILLLTSFERRIEESSIYCQSETEHACDYVRVEFVGPEFSILMQMIQSNIPRFCALLQRKRIRFFEKENSNAMSSFSCLPQTLSMIESNMLPKRGNR